MAGREGARRSGSFVAAAALACLCLVVPPQLFLAARSRVPSHQRDSLAARGQRVRLAALQRPDDPGREEESIFGDLSGDEEDTVGLRRFPFAARGKGQDLAPKGSEDIEPEDVNAGPPPMDLPEGGDDAMKPPTGDLRPEEAIEVSADEVQEFLAELAAVPAVKPLPEGAVPLDPMEYDAKKTADIFKEVQRSPMASFMYARGLPSQQTLVTLKDRMAAMTESAEAGDWFRTRYVLKQIWRRRKLRLPCGRILWNLMIKAHMKAGRPIAAESWVEDMLGRVFQPDLISYNTLLSAFSKQGNFLKAEKWVRRMKARGVNPDKWTIAALANAYANADLLEGAERTVLASQEAGIELNAASYNAILKLCARRGQDVIAQRWFDIMQKQAVKPDSVTYLLLIRASGKAGALEQAASWLDHMEETQTPKRYDHLHAVVQPHARIGDMRGAEAWLKVMEDIGLPPQVKSFNILLAAAAQRGDPEAAQGIMAKMMHDGLDPDIVSYSTVIGAFAEAGDAEGARQWLLRAERDGLEPDLQCYNQVIKACARAGNASLAEHTARRLLRHSHQPDMYTYISLLKAFAKNGDPAVAEWWVDHMQRTARWTPGNALGEEFPRKQVSSVYSEALIAHVRSGNLEAAEAWLSQMLGEGVEPDPRCYIYLANAHLKQGRREEAKKWCHRMSQWSNYQVPRALQKAVFFTALPESVSSK